MEEYSWELSENAEIWNNDAYDTIDECIEAAREANAEDGGEHTVVFIGRNVPFIPSVDVETVLDNIQEQAAEECGQVGHDWDAYDHKKREELDELQERMDEVLHEWMKKYKYYPGICAVEDIHSYSL